jgi:hypothetical protein
MKVHRIVAGMMFLFLMCACAVAGTIEKKYPDGTVKLKYSIDKQGDKNGGYEEFFSDGKPKIKAVYKDDKLDGPYQSFHVNGKPHISAIYKGGELSGAYSEASDEGLKKLTATYKDGKLNGTLTRFDKDQPIFTQVYKDGEAAYPRSLADMKKKLSELMTAPTGTDAEREAGLRRLKAYRYLAEVPYDNVEIDEELTKGALAAAAISEKNGKLDHMPKNPGLPEADFKIAANACKNSNLARGPKTFESAIDAWMWDSDAGNIQGLGHRRWALNPPLRKTGFGKSGPFIAMWALDRSQKEVPDFDAVFFPPRGLMPVEFLGQFHAWSVSLNPRKFKAPTDAVTAKVSPIDAQLNSTGEPLPLNFFKASTQIFGLPYCLIFRPEKVAVTPGKRYLVEIEGLLRADGKPASPMIYVVEFVSLR